MRPRGGIGGRGQGAREFALGPRHDDRTSTVACAAVAWSCDGPPLTGDATTTMAEPPQRDTGGGGGPHPQLGIAADWGPYPRLVGTDRVDTSTVSSVPG